MITELFANIFRIINSRRTRLAGYVARMAEKINLYRVFVGNPEGKRPLGRPRLMWDDDNKMALRDMGWRGLDWINLVHDRNQWRALVNTTINLWVP
jgi:hypothetical protein